MRNFRTINNYDYTNLQSLKLFIETKNNKNTIYPDNLQTHKQKMKYRNQFYEFTLKSNNIVYYDKIVIPDDQVQDTLKQLYVNNITGFTGMDSFYKIISSKYINITREQARSFLADQQQYQITKIVPKRNTPTKHYKTPNAAWYYDLIDLHHDYINNRGYRYIMSVLDAYTRNLKLFILKNKKKETILNELSDYMETNNIKPKVLISDNGGEFKNDIMKEYAKANNIKLIFGLSYDPVKQIENVNGQIRRLLSKTFVNNKNLIWYNKIKEIEDSINDYVDITFDPENQTVLKQIQPYKINDKCRIKTSVYSSNVRKLIKTGNSKYVYIKWSTSIFIIYKVARKYKKNNMLPQYNIKTEENEIIINEETGKPLYIKHNDIQVITNSFNNKVDGDDERYLNATEF